MKAKCIKNNTDDYINLAKDMYKSINSSIFKYGENAVKYRGEIHIQNNGYLLRLDKNGFFRSLYYLGN